MKFPPLHIFDGIPLRLSIITVSNFHDIIEDLFKVEREKIENLNQQELDVLIAETVSNIEVIAKYGEERITIPLDNETNAKKVRVILSSMIQNGYYNQITNYHVDKEVIKREQKIDTTELNPQLKVMLEIAKDWKGFDVNQFRVKSQRMNGR